MEVLLGGFVVVLLGLVIGLVITGLDKSQRIASLKEALSTARADNNSNLTAYNAENERADGLEETLSDVNAEYSLLQESYAELLDVSNKHKKDAEDFHADLTVTAGRLFEVNAQLSWADAQYEALVAKKKKKTKTAKVTTKKVTKKATVKKKTSKKTK